MQFKMKISKFQLKRIILKNKSFNTILYDLNRLAKYNHQSTLSNSLTENLHFIIIFNLIWPNMQNAENAIIFAF